MEVSQGTKTNLGKVFSAFVHDPTFLAPVRNSWRLSVAENLEALCESWCNIVAIGVVGKDNVDLDSALMGSAPASAEYFMFVYSRPSWRLFWWRKVIFD